ncbi:tetratricopeptide repeat protein [Salipiger sp. P9]|uniref:tetratricopeptide repeat protein n=1 Tax=Salipiger pentaromativorans TaxID=2943193 RepID=UPI002157120F|nr:tetratricopeptide repeat protein [Salipiger pentaromativorans]MCR8547011.1 tetratricopeptide repeat protein [Salipiger pentaromativorans]
MSDTDSFIDEVTEEVRRDRLFALMKRYGWLAVLLVLVLVGGAAWREYAAARDRAAAEALGDAILSALDADDPAARSAALAAVDAPTPGAQAVVAMLAATEAARAGDADTAAQSLESVAANGDLPEIYREIASFKALSRPDTGLSPEDRRIGLEALAVPGKPLRLLAEEQLALIEIEAGAREAAIDRLRRIIEDSEATAGLRQRATQLIVALGGAPEAG